MQQLLYASSVPVSQFASLSLVLSDGGIAEPITAVGPHATCSAEVAATSIRELHTHVRRIVAASNKKKADVADDDFVSQLLREEESSLSSMQVYHPICGNGVALHYRFIRGSNNSETSRLQALILAVNKSAPGKADPSSGILGVLLCVAIAGMGPITSAASVQQRMNDCLGYLTRVNDLTVARSLLASYLLSEDDYRISNERMVAPNVLLLPGSDELRSRGILSPLGMISPIAEFGRTARRASTGIVRGVMSAGAGIGGGGGSGAFGGNNPQDGGGGGAPPVDLGFAVRLDTSAAEAARTLLEKLTVLSVAESGTILRKYTSTGRDRMANLDLTGGAKSRFRRKKSDSTRVADFEHFDYKGPSRTIAQRESKMTISSTLSPISEQPAVGKLQLKSSSKDTKRGGPGTRRMSTHVGSRDEESSYQSARKNNTGSDLLNHKKKTRTQFDDETHDSRSHSGNHDGSSVLSQERVQINIALNEDLTCSYKLSQLSSCNVEGVVQAQIKATSRPSNMPFSLLVRDLSSQLDTLHENKKFAEKVVASRHQNGDADYRFKVTLPKRETYYPLLKYKCTGDLRPVPIRVQTKVKIDAGFCRVALQISSNPNNDATLSDLTIVMGVSNQVRGETLATQPAGGVWDKSKSTVVWCVSELASGEKFQLQARFELEKGVRAGNDLHFPVLVRCQCLHVQLSDVEFEVSDSPNESVPTELIMKVARRYRLSHREKNA